MLADVKIELDEERRFRGHLENELAQKDDVLKAVRHCDKDNTGRRSLGGNSVGSESARVPNKEDLLEPTLPGTSTSGTKSQAAKPEVFDIGTDSEDEAEMSG
eukprot:Skav208110  [mRNA]  locus=scaffold3082:27690:27995:- [translate_table: standard]